MDESLLFQNDLMAEEDTLAQHDVLVSSAPLAETNTAACEPHTCTAPSRDSVMDLNPQKYKIKLQNLSLVSELNFVFIAAQGR